MFSRIVKPFSLEKRLQFTLGLLILITLGALILLAGWLGREATYQFVSTRLAHDAEAIITGLDPLQGQLGQPPPAIYNQPLSGHYFVIRFSVDRQIRSRSLWDATLEALPQPPGKQQMTLATGLRHQKLLVLHLGYEKKGNAFTIAITEDISPLLRAINRFLWIGAVVTIVAALLLLFTQKLILRSIFRSLDRLRQGIRAIQGGEKESLSPQVPNEIRPLVDEFNQLLGSWRAHLTRSRSASGNLAHALKTPLNLLYQTGIERKEGDITEQVERMRWIIERELNRARIAGRVSAGQRFTPYPDLTDLIDTIRLIHRHKELEITLNCQSNDPLPFDRDDILELVGNLLDNAGKWAQKQIHVSLSGEKTVMLKIEDDGPGINQEQSECVLKRGNRLDEQTPGHGLGLSIISEIVEQYGGKLGITRSSKLGGACICVSLPRVETHLPPMP